MTWNYHEATGDESIDALNNIKEWANNNYNGFCAKYAASDQHHGTSRAVIFYSDAALPIPATEPSDAKWYMQVFGSDSNYTQLYTDAVGVLNKLTPYQQFYASVMYTNAQDNPAQIAVIYPG